MQKGGVGKTTTAMNVAYELGQHGLAVLLIDVDQQAHATSGLGVTVGPDDATMFEVLHPDRQERVPLSDVIQHSAFGVDVAPGAYALRSLERTGLGTAGQLRLAQGLESVSERYEVVVIDCPPALGDLTVAALAANLDAMGYFPTTHAVFGAMADKDLASMFTKLLPLLDRWYFTDLPLPRAAKGADLMAQWQALNTRKDTQAAAFADPMGALQAAIRQADPADRIVVFGSFYTVGGVLINGTPRLHAKHLGA